MIRINLLGIPRPKKGKKGGGAAATGYSGEGPSGSLLLVAGLLVGLGVGGGLWYMADRDAKDIASKMATAQQEGLRLADVKVKYDQRKKEAEAFDKRVKVIDQLRENQAGPVLLLTTVGTTVNNTDAVWLREMSEAGNAVNIDGTALSTIAVANLMANLKRTGFFKSVEIKDTTQDAQQKDMAAFNFSLVCEKLPPQAAQPKTL